MATTVRRNETAQQAYYRIQVEIREAMGRLDTMLKKDAEGFEAGGKTNWGYVGSLETMLENIKIALREID